MSECLGSLVLSAIVVVLVQAHYSTGEVAQGFTCTVTAPVTENEAAVVDRDTLLYAKVKKKGE